MPEVLVPLGRQRKGGTLERVAQVTLINREAEVAVGQKHG